MIEKVINFGSILDGFWVDFGRILDDFGGDFSSSISDGLPRAIQERSGTDIASKNVQNRVSPFSWERLVSDLLPRDLQEGPRGLQEGPRGSQEGPMASVFGPFLN